MIELITEGLKRFPARPVLIQKNTGNACFVFPHRPVEPFGKFVTDPAFPIGYDGDVGIFIPFFHKADRLCERSLKIGAAAEKLLCSTDHIA